MQDFAQWSLDAIREEGGCFSWLEEHRFEWTTTTLLAIEQILEAKTIIIITDERRKWLERYIISNINTPQLDRPFLSITSIDSIYPYFKNIESSENIDTLEDLLNTTYNKNYFFWYIGRGEDRRADIAKRSDSSYFWILDEEYLSAFMLKSYDKNLDIKLLQLFKLLNRSISASIFGEVEIGV